MTDKKKAIGFDCWDTLLVRPFINPADLFGFLGKGFKERRIDAERQARREKKEPNLYDIYENLPDADARAEIEAEKRFSRPRADVLEIFNRAKKDGMAVVIVSDFYMPAADLAEILEKNGVVGYDKLFVSCDYGKSKRGGLFDEVAKEYELVGFYGDNKKADIEPLQGRVFDLHHLKRYADLFLAAYPRLKQLDFANWRVSYWAGLCAIDWNENKARGYWERLGFMLGVFNYAFCQWIKEKVEQRGIKRLLFVARDGWTLEKIYNRIDPATPTAYIYANRLLLKRQAAEPDKGEYKGYLTAIFDNQPEPTDTAVIDTLTHRYSAFRFLKIPDALLILVMDCKRSGEFKTLSFNKAPALQLKNWDFMELLITAPTPPIVDIDEAGAPIYGTNDEEEKRLPVVADICRGVLDFQPDPAVRFIYRDVMPILNNFFDNLTEQDKAEFATIKHSPTGGHTKYRDIFKG